MKRLLVAVFATGLALSGHVALAESPITATVANCELNIQGSNLPVNALVDLTVQSGNKPLRFTQKIQTTAFGTASATVRLRDLFPGKDINGGWGVSIDIGITSVTVSGCVTALPNTSTN